MILKLQTDTITIELSHTIINPASLELEPPCFIWCNRDHRTGAAACAKVHTTRDHMIDHSSHFSSCKACIHDSWGKLDSSFHFPKTYSHVFFFSWPSFSEPNCWSPQLMAPLYQPKQSCKSETEKGEGSLLKGRFA